VRSYESYIDPLLFWCRTHFNQIASVPTVPIALGDVHSLMRHCDATSESQVRHLLPLSISLE
jgi:hypothetical protein